MLSYFIDEKQKFKDELLLHLRAHNELFVSLEERISKYIYIYKDNSLLGAIRATLHWNWVGYNTPYYKNLDVLKVMISESVKLFIGKTAGFKMRSVINQEIQDFQQIGFKEVGRIPHPINQDIVYLDLVDLEILSKNKYEVVIRNEEDIAHKYFLKKYSKKLEQDNEIEEIDDILYVCTKNDTFCGGIQFEVYKHHIHTHLLAVKKEYKGHRIGTKLMSFVEEYAKNLGLKLLTVGTTSFQAREFYEKCGYHVVYTRKEHPKGYEAYTLIKELKE